MGLIQLGYACLYNNSKVLSFMAPQQGVDHLPHLFPVQKYRVMGSLELPADVSHRIGPPLEGGRATIMGIGKAVPSYEFQQKSFADYYFEITNSNHMVDLKAKFAKICKSELIIWLFVFVATIYICVYGKQIFPF